MELLIRNLSKTYANGVRALHDVSLTIPNGMFGLLGPNGAGKSSLMRTIATLQEPDFGTITLGNIDVLTGKDAVRRVLGYLPQEFGLYPSISAEVLLDHFASLKGIRDGRERKLAVVEALLQQTNLWAARKKNLGGFSGGMRQRNGLKPKERLPRLHDPRGLMTCGFTSDADYARFETTVSTDPDQTAIAPGYLQKEWVANGRRYFHYRMDTPMLNFYSIHWARYALRRAQWHDPTTGQPVAIEIYYHPAHAYNVPRMVDALQKGLTYYTKEFGPYQYRQVRIQEFPRYKAFAQSFPNTIPTSEGAGFIADLRDKTKPDGVFFITNHELGHQWWGHQVVGANVQGSAMLSESLAEYSSLMTCKHEFSAPQMQKRMRAELDGYLSGRRNERKKEMPLLLVENQPYIHYNKGGMVFFALQDYIGEEKLNGAIKAFLAKARYQSRPYPNTADFLSYIKKATPDSLQSVLHDMFETITLFENQLDDATYAKRPDGRYDVRLTLRASKMRADSLGNETPIRLNDYVDVGIFGPYLVKKTEGFDASGKPLFFQKVKLTKPLTVLHFVVPSTPGKAGVDPYHKRIDRHYQDNVKAVAASGAAPARTVASR